MKIARNINELPIDDLQELIDWSILGIKYAGFYTKIGEFDLIFMSLLNEKLKRLEL